MLGRRFSDELMVLSMKNEHMVWYIPPTRARESLGRQTQALPSSCWRYIILFNCILMDKVWFVSYLHA